MARLIAHRVPHRYGRFRRRWASFTSLRFVRFSRSQGDREAGRLMGKNNHTILPVSPSPCSNSPTFRGLRGLVRPAGSSFRDLAAHGNESRGSWIERRWLLVRDLDECASRDPSGRASRRSRGGGMRSTTSWSAHGSSSGFPTELVQRGSPCSQVAATASCVSGEPGGRFVRASSRSWTRRGAAGHLA
jgi:hypothetical protein